MVYESDFYTTRRPYRANPSVSSYTVSTIVPSRQIRILPGIGKVHVVHSYDRMIPYIGHKRITVIPSHRSPHVFRVRPSVIVREIDRITHKPRPYLYYTPSLIHSEPISFFDHETALIRAQTNSLLKSIHAPVPRYRVPWPISKVRYQYEPLPARLTSDDYINRMLTPIKTGHEDIYNISHFINAPIRRHLGPSYYGNKAYSRRYYSRLLTYYPELYRRFPSYSDVWRVHPELWRDNSLLPWYMCSDPSHFACMRHYDYERFLRNLRLCYPRYTSFPELYRRHPSYPDFWRVHPDLWRDQPMLSSYVYTGPSHLACVRYSGDKAYSKRRNLTLQEIYAMQSDTVRNDIQLLSYYIKANKDRKTREAATPAQASLNAMRPSRHFSKPQMMLEPSVTEEMRELRDQRAERMRKIQELEDTTPAPAELEAARIKRNTKKQEEERLAEERALAEEQARQQAAAKKEEEARRAELARQEALAAQAAAERQAELDRQAELARKAEEEKAAAEALEKARLEAERAAAEEQVRIEAERAAAEAAEKAAAEAAAAEAARLEEEKRQEEERQALLRLEEIQRQAEEEKENELARQAEELAELARQEAELAEQAKREAELAELAKQEAELAELERQERELAEREAADQPAPEDAEVAAADSNIPAEEATTDEEPATSEPEPVTSPEPAAEAEVTSPEPEPVVEEPETPEAQEDAE